MERALTTVQVEETSDWPDSPAKRSIQLAVCFWETGDVSKAREVLAGVVAESDLDQFSLKLMQSIVESGALKLSLSLLERAEPFLESVGPLRRGKFFNQRGYLLRRMKKPDRAIIAYTEARYWFEQAGDPKRLAGVTNNLASIFSDVEDFEQAHQSVDEAIRCFTSLGAESYLEQARDQQAQICLAEARSLTKRGGNLKAFQQLEHRIKVAKNMLAACDIARIELALQESEGSFRLAAKRLGITHPTLSKMIKTYDLKWKGNKPLRRQHN